MSTNNDKKSQKQKAQRHKRKKRAAVQRDGKTVTIVRQNSSKGYDVAMIRDFLEHLLVELRAQHYENITVLRKLDQTNEIGMAIKAAEDKLSPVLLEQFKRFQQKYVAALLASNVIDGKGATETEIRDYTKAILKHSIVKRDEEIGHLEALQSLFDEALACAKLPFGRTADGELVEPYQVHRVREFIDDLRARQTVPPHDNLG